MPRHAAPTRSIPPGGANDPPRPGGTPDMMPRGHGDAPAGARYRIVENRRAVRDGGRRRIIEPGTGRVWGEGAGGRLSVREGKVRGRGPPGWKSGPPPARVPRRGFRMRAAIWGRGRPPCRGASAQTFQDRVKRGPRAPPGPGAGRSWRIGAVILGGNAPKRRGRPYGSLDFGQGRPARV